MMVPGGLSACCTAATSLPRSTDDPARSWFSTWPSAISIELIDPSAILSLLTEPVARSALFTAPSRILSVVTLPLTSLAVVTFASAILAVVIVASANFAVFTLRSAILALLTAPARMVLVVTAPSLIMDDVTEALATVSATLERMENAALTICWRGETSASTVDEFPSSTVSPRYNDDVVAVLMMSLSVLYGWMAGALGPAKPDKPVPLPTSTLNSPAEIVAVCTSAQMALPPVEAV